MVRRTRGIQQTILANDPSMTAWGWVILTVQGDIIDKGCIKTQSGGKKRRIRKGDETVQRISEINNVLISKIREHNVVLMISELPHGSQNAQGALMIGVVAAIGQTISDCLNIGIEWFSEGDAKKCLFNRQAVTKQETINKIDSLYNIPWFNVKYKDEAIADAMAIYHVASKQSNTLKMLKNI